MKKLNITVSYSCAQNKYIVLGDLRLARTLIKDYLRTQVEVEATYEKENLGKDCFILFEVRGDSIILHSDCESQELRKGLLIELHRQLSED